MTLELDLKSLVYRLNKKDEGQFLVKVSTTISSNAQLGSSCQLVSHVAGCGGVHQHCHKIFTKQGGLYGFKGAGEIKENNLQGTFLNICCSTT